ncbi:Cro/CI family transcriptional regulator [Snodgrassella alvi]|uniref:Cro/CI family transcriptional regulator n=1 Tax=Snodgrassella alvi TaxID=1196083 RepID=UPI00352FC009
MKKTSLFNYVKNHGQYKTAQKLGLTQGAISKALKDGRKIYIKFNRTGKLRAIEIRPFPSSSNCKLQRENKYDDN